MATRRFVHHSTVHDEAGTHLPNERGRATLQVPRGLGSTVVAVGVPVLVDE